MMCPYNPGHQVTTGESRMDRRDGAYSWLLAVASAIAFVVGVSAQDAVRPASQGVVTPDSPIFAAQNPDPSPGPDPTNPETPDNPVVPPTATPAPEPGSGGGRGRGGFPRRTY